MSDHIPFSHQNQFDDVVSLADPWRGFDWSSQSGSRRELIDACQHFIYVQSSRFGRLISSTKRQFLHLHLTRAVVFKAEASKQPGYLESEFSALGIEIAHNASSHEQAHNAAILRLLTYQEGEEGTSASDITRNSQAMTGVERLLAAKQLVPTYNNTDKILDLIRDHSRGQLAELGKKPAQSKVRIEPAKANQSAVQVLVKSEGADPQPESSPPVSRALTSPDISRDEPPEVLSEVQVPPGFPGERFILYAERTGDVLRIFGPIAVDDDVQRYLQLIDKTAAGVKS